MAAFQVGVEPGPRLEVDAADGQRAAGEAESLVERRGIPGGGGDDAGVVDHVARGVRVGAVHDQLHGCGLAGVEAAFVAGVDLEYGGGAGGVDERAGLVVVEGPRDFVEVGGAGETRDELAAGDGVVAVHDGEWHVADIERDGVAEDHRLDDRQAENDQAHAWIAEHGAELFSQEGEDAFPHGGGGVCERFRRDVCGCGRWRGRA
ncbi:MAG: hypothetical protein BWX86_02087 [Verrucomicrobia bacterium ADurb.Bin122]|nr:MAG: hypothetical protein BWX86_02087 [Verrucomicrobia bacterium ADurb.Bin122]